MPGLSPSCPAPSSCPIPLVMPDPPCHARLDRASFAPRSFTSTQILFCHSERAQRAEESDRRAKAAGEENLCRLFPAAGAAVAARPAIWRAALPTSRTSSVPKNRHFWSQNYPQTPFVPKNPLFWARTSRRSPSDGQDLILCLGPYPHIGHPGSSGGQDTRHEIRPCPLKCCGKGLAYKDPSLTLRMTIIVQQLSD